MSVTASSLCTHFFYSPILTHIITSSSIVIGERDRDRQKERMMMMMMMVVAVVMIIMIFIFISDEKLKVDLHKLQIEVKNIKKEVGTKTFIIFSL